MKFDNKINSQKVRSLGTIFQSLEIVQILRTAKLFSKIDREINFQGNIFLLKKHNFKDKKSFKKTKKILKQLENYVG